MITASEIKKKAERKYQGYLRRIVVCEPFEPIVIPCDKKASPTMTEYEKELKDVRSLSKEVKGYGYTIEWKKVNSKNLIQCCLIHQRILSVSCIKQMKSFAFGKIFRLYLPHFLR